MKPAASKIAYLLISVLLLVAACGRTAMTERSSGQGHKVLAVETFLADVAQNVAGERLTVQSLLPIGADPHGFEPVPADLVKVAESTILIVNGAGFEEFLDRMLQNAGGRQQVVEAAAGLTPRQPKDWEATDEHSEGDPHFWLDPNNVIIYVENIRNALVAADPAGKTAYVANADAYIKKLRDLDVWIREEVKQVPEERRLLVTNHESLGYFADRYGFKVIGTILHSASSSASPSAQELAALVDDIKRTGAKAIFLETGTNPQLAQQVARETGIKVVLDLYTHSISKGGPAPTYIDMMTHNVKTIVNALK